MDKIYNQNYYENYDVGIARVNYKDSPNTKDFLQGVAQQITKLGIRTVLDVGCAMGHLVAGLRDLGVEAYGIDVSEYAISEIRDDIKQYCNAQSVLEDLPKYFPEKFDLVITIEVFEHIQEVEARTAVVNLCRWSDTIIFCSTPDDFEDPTHLNVRQREYWVSLFAENGFYDDLENRPTFITSYSMCFRKGLQPLHQIEEYERFIRITENEHQKQLLETKKKKYSSQIYWSGEEYGFNEEHKITYSGDLSDGGIRFQINLPESVNALRFDPTETPCVVEDLHIYSNEGSLQVIAENGIEYQGKYVFLEHDPRFNIIIDGKQISSLDIRAHVTPLEFPEHEELLTQLFDNKNQMVKLLAEQETAYKTQIEECNKTYQSELKLNLDKLKNLEKEQDKLLFKQKELEDSLSHYMTHYHAAIGQREELKQQLAQAQNAYNVISNAFFWKITKPARMLVDFIKKPFRKSHSAMLVWKGMKCLKQNGFKYTYNKVQDKLKHRQDYTSLAKKPLFTKEELEEQKNFQFSKKIKFSIVVPLYNTPPKFLHEMIQSVIDQTYADWELCMADGSDKAHSDVGQICRSYYKRDSRIKYRKLDKNLGISGNTNVCLDMATGDYIGLFDHDDLLHPAALYEVMRTICETGADFIYTDEALFEDDISNIKMVHYKPDFAPDTLRSYNYICHLSMVKTELIEKVGRFDSTCDGSQDFDMVLRISDEAEKIVHIPEILYYWRIHSNSVSSGISAKPYCIDAAKKALYSHLKRNGYEGEVLDAPVLTMYRIKYKIKGNPLVSILIPSHNHCDDLRRCIQSIQMMSTYKNYEIIIIENGSVEEDVFSYYKELEKYENIKIIYWDKGFNYAAINNYGARYANGEYYILLNNDTKVITPEWIEEMLMFAQRDDVGAVGAKLYYENGTVQHAGIIVGIGGSAGHSHKHANGSDVGYMARLVIAQNLSGVTGACLMVSKGAFWDVDGLDEQFVVAFNDVDFCLRLREKGYLNVFTPYAELMHYESLSRGYEDTPEKQIRFSRERDLLRSRWWRVIEVDGDPYYNPNLTLDREDFSIK